LGFDTARRDATERFAPILMTALATDSVNIRREIEPRMAAVLVGGLFTPTLPSLLVPPTLALRCRRFERNREADIDHAR
jgi:Cu/Ag efflux pump CusA